MLVVLAGLLAKSQLALHRLVPTLPVMLSFVKHELAPQLASNEAADPDDQVVELADGVADREEVLLEGCDVKIRLAQTKAVGIARAPFGVRGVLGVGLVDRVGDPVCQVADRVVEVQNADVSKAVEWLLQDEAGGNVLVVRDLYCHEELAL